MCVTLNKDLKHITKEEQLLYQNFTGFCATTQGQKCLRARISRVLTALAHTRSTVRLGDRVEAQPRAPGHSRESPRESL